MKRIFLAVFMLITLCSTPHAYAYTISMSGDGATGINTWNSTTAQPSLYYDYDDHVAEWGDAIDAYGYDTVALSGQFSISSSVGNTGPIDTQWGLFFSGSAYVTGAKALGAKTSVVLGVYDSNHTEAFYKFFEFEDDNNNGGTVATVSAKFDIAPEIVALNLDETYSWVLRVGVSGAATYPDENFYVTGDAESIANFSILTEDVATPIPGAIWLLGSGFVGLIGLRRKFA